MVKIGRNSSISTVNLILIIILAIILIYMSVLLYGYFTSVFSRLELQQSITLPDTLGHIY
jgi:predicted Na+-dependent transporter